MAVIPIDIGSGGKGLAKSAPVSLKDILFGIQDDLAAQRAAFVAFTAKLDTDFVAQNAAVTSSQLDVDYASTVDPVALVTTKGT